MRENSALLPIAFAAALATSADAQDNILILIADDLGVDYVAAYGEGPAYGPTPNIDALAAQGVLFRNAWADPTCSATRACFHTGRHGYRTGVGSPGAGSALDLVEVTLPEALDASGSGYAHALIGKWHLGGAGGGGGGNPDYPNESGWSHFAGMLGNPGDYFDWTRTVDGVQSQSTTYATTQIVDDAIAWISQQSQPWICTVAFNAPHAPFHAPPDHLHTQTLTSGSTNQELYRAMVEAMDTEIGRLIASLGPDLPHTNVLFFGDNGTPGPVSVAPFQSSHAKGSPYEGGVNVPFIVAGPAVASPNREVTALVSVVDVFASVADLIGTDIAPPFIVQDSISFVPYLEDPNQAPLRSFVYSERFDGGQADTDGFAAARGDRFKLIRFYGPGGVASEEMYDLTLDPFETTNLIPPLSAEQQLAYDGLDAHILSIRDKAGGFEILGAPSCVGSSGAPQITAAGEPAVGQSYAVLLTQAPPSTVAWLAVGISDTHDSNLGVDLPLDLSIHGAGPGCLLHSSTEWLAPVPTSSLGAALAPISVPAESTLIKGTILHSWIVPDPNAPNNPAGLTVTPALLVTLGG